MLSPLKIAENNSRNPQWQEFDGVSSSDRLEWLENHETSDEKAFFGDVVIPKRTFSQVVYYKEASEARLTPMFRYF